MSTAQQLLIGYGVIIAGVGFVLGAILGSLRMKRPSVRNLATAHVETLMQAGLILGLGFAVGATGFSSGWATTAAWLLVIGAAMQAVGVTLNWIQNVGDQFAEKSPGYIVNSLSTFAALPGLIIIIVGVVGNL